MPTPSLVGDFHGMHPPPGDKPPIGGSIVAGSNKTLFTGKPVAIMGKTTSSVGRLSAETLVASKVYVEGSPVVCVNSLVMIPPPGYGPAPIKGPGCPKVTVK